MLLGGRVYTGDPARPWAEAVAIEGERIAAVGTDEEVRARAGAATRVVSLHGRLVIPGINDAHVHQPWEQLDGVELEVPPDVSPAALLELIRQAAASAPQGTWITGRIPPSFIDAGFSRADLDSAAPSHPVWLALGHAVLLGTGALRAWGIEERAEDPPGVRFGRTPDGALDGWVLRYPRWEAPRRAAAGRSDEVFLASMRRFEDRALRWGITSVQTFPIVPVDRMRRLLDALDPRLRWHVIEFQPPVEGGGGEHDVKYILDGTPVERGSALLEPYADRPQTTGAMYHSAAALDMVVRNAARADHQLLVHVSGDGAAQALIDAMERVDGASWPDRRVRIEHGDLFTDDQLDALARLGIVVVVNPSHLRRPELVAARFGPERKARFNRARSLLARGVPLALGSDGPLNPYLNMMFVTDHLANPPEALSIEQALAAYTRGAAHAQREETRKGIIAPGMAADLAVLSQDITRVPAASLPDTESVMTIIGGRIVLEAGSGTARRSEQ